MKLRIVNKKRFISAIALIISLLILYIAIVISMSIPEKQYKYKTYKVEAGDTLWDIAKANIDNTVNIQEYIYKIEKLNNCTADIRIGQELTLIEYIGG